MSIWDIYIMILLLYTAFWMPYQISFIDDPSTGLLVLDYFVDTCFFIDIILTFNTTYYDKDGLLVVKRKTIAAEYLKGWFFIDFLTILPVQLIQ